MDNQGLLTIITVLLLGIFVTLIIQAYEKTPEEKIANNVSEITERVVDKIDTQN